MGEGKLGFGMPSKIRVLVAGAHQLIRQMLVTVLESQPDLEVVAQAASARAAVELSLGRRPHVLLLDLMPPQPSQPSGIEVAGQVHSGAPEVGILVLAEDEGALLDSLAAGARGYLLKDSSVQDLVAALRAVHSGRAVLPPRGTLCLLQEFQRHRALASQRSSEDPLVLERLTRRELEVLRLVGQGCSNREIGKKLLISEKTAKTHVANLLRRTGAKDRIAAALLAVRCGLCDGLSGDLGQRQPPRGRLT